MRPSRQGPDPPAPRQALQLAGLTVFAVSQPEVIVTHTVSRQRLHEGERRPAVPTLRLGAGGEQGPALSLEEFLGTV